MSRRTSSTNVCVVGVLYEDVLSRPATSPPSGRGPERITTGVCRMRRWNERSGPTRRRRRTVLDMALLMARTSAEAHLYIRLQPCECGEALSPGQSTIIEAGDDLARRYSATCSACGTTYEFTFRLPEQVLSASSGAVVFGDGTPSELLDPGDWLWVADSCARGVAWDTSQFDQDRLRAARTQMATAEAAMNEVLAFVPPDGDAVPPEAFRTDRGRAVYEAEPGRFSRDRLEVVRATYREILGELDTRVAG